MNRIADNLAIVEERIAKAAWKSGRSPEAIQLVVVTKDASVADIEAVLEAGATVIAENRIQEATQKFKQVNSLIRKVTDAAKSTQDFEWHLIGHLQRNKVKPALQMFSLIHSVDSLRLFSEISKRTVAEETTTDVLIQVNTTGEENKYGLNLDVVSGMIEESAIYPNVQVCGLMTIGKLTSDPEDNRSAFESLRALAGKIEGRKLPNVDMNFLSMGMTNDFEVAIEEGANLVRIGRAIFGEN